MNSLNKLLASVAVLKQKAQNLHWNVRGADFMPMHKLTQGLYEGLDGLFDDIAEKIAMQGKLPFSRLEDYVKESILEEIEPKRFTTREVVEILVKDLKEIHEFAKKVETNQYIQPLLDEIFLFLDKQLWFFESSK